MSTTPDLTRDLQRLVLQLEDDLRMRVEGLSDVTTKWRTEYEAALSRGRTAASWQSWRDDRVTQAAVAWVLATVFVRFCEANSLIRPVWIAGTGARSEEAVQAQLAFFRAHPEETDREWLLDAIGYLASLPATANLVGNHSALHLVSPSGDAASALIDFWRQRGDDGRLVRDFADPATSTRFLGDLYQDISLRAKETYALLQTPDFVEDFILDRTLEPALRERPLDGFRMIDPACGSGHFLLGAFARLLDRWDREAPGMEIQARVQLALDAVHGVDINPFAVAIAQFRLIVTALQECGLQQLEDAPAFKLHVAVGDSLLHGQPQQEFNLGQDVDPSVTVSRFAYSTEDFIELQRILQPMRYDVVVANPPYITVRDDALNRAYRLRYGSCKGLYALTVPFTERLFGLARAQSEQTPAGWVGQITSNSFMKREFGSKLIEEFLIRKDLRLLVDTSGAYIPGHGTPTVIMVGCNAPAGGRPVRAVLGNRGEPGRPKAPRYGLVWSSIAAHVDMPGWEDAWISVADLGRDLLARHPWSLSGGGAVELRTRLDRERGGVLSQRVKEIGFGAVTREDSAYMLGAGPLRRRGVPEVHRRPIVEGDVLRDWQLLEPIMSAWPYDPVTLAPEADANLMRLLWPYRTLLSDRVAYGDTQLGRGLTWFEYSMFFRERFRTALSIACAFVATHNHFVLDRGGKVFKQSAPVIKLQAAASEDDHLQLLSVLNSSTACFWLKQNSHSKGNEGYQSGIKSENWERFWEFTATTLQEFPLPPTLPLERARILAGLAEDHAAVLPSGVCSGSSVPSFDALEIARVEHDRIRGCMIAVQEELDWDVYRLYGLIDEDLTCHDADLPNIALGGRAFEIMLARAVAAGEEQTAWFSRHGSIPITDIPNSWPAAYVAVVGRRLDCIASNPSIRLLERPEYKRRWADRPWDEQEAEALRSWLLDRLEASRLWFDAQGRPAPCSIGQLADEVSRDHGFVSVLALWERRLDVPVTRSLTRLFADEAVPYLAAYRYTEAGLRKREAWEETWALQRREDAGEKVGPIPVPPKYAPADFRGTANWRARGKLDVPKERFILYPDAGRDTDPSVLLGWSGWDQAQQALAVNLIIGQREAEGWADPRLIPLVAGLAELQPWIEQWHRGVDSTTGVDLAAFCREELVRRAAQVGCTLSQLAAWRPQTQHKRSPRP